MNEQTNLKNNNLFKFDNFISTKKRTLQEDEDFKDNDKKIKLEQKEYCSEIKNQSKNGYNATFLIRRLFFRKRDNQKIEEKKELDSSLEIEIEKEKYENEILELKKQCLAYEYQIKNLSSINKLLTDKNIELYNANKKFELLLKEKNNDNNEIENINNNDEKSKNKEDIGTIKKQNVIIKSLNDTIKYYQITIEEQKKELDELKTNYNCSGNKFNQSFEDKGKNLENQRLLNLKQLNENSQFQNTNKDNNSIENATIHERKGEKESLFSHTYCNTNTNETDIPNILNKSSNSYSIEKEENLKNNKKQENNANNNIDSSINDIEKDDSKIDKEEDISDDESVEVEEKNSKVSIKESINDLNNNEISNENQNIKMINNIEENDKINKDCNIEKSSNFKFYKEDGENDVNDGKASIKNMTSLLNEATDDNVELTSLEKSKSLFIFNKNQNSIDKEVNIEELTRQYNDINNTCHILESLVEQKQNQIKEYELQLKELKESINEQLDLINKLNMNINNQNLLLESNKHKIITLETVIKENSSIIINNNNEIEKLEETIDKLENQNNKNIKIISESQSLIEHHKAIADSAKTTTEHQKIIIQGLEKQIEKLHQNIVRKDKEIENMKKNSQINEENLKKLKNILEEDKQLIQKIENENRILKSEKNALEIDLKSKQSDNNNNENTIEIISKNNQHLENTIIRYKRDIQKLRHKLITLEMKAPSPDNNVQFTQDQSFSNANENIKKIESKIKRLLEIFGQDDNLINKKIIIFEIKRFYDEYQLLIKTYVNEINDNRSKLDRLYNTLKDTNLLLKDKEDLIKDYDSKQNKLLMKIKKINQENLQLKENILTEKKTVENFLIRINKLEEIIKMYENIGEKEIEEKGEKNILFYKLELQKTKELYENTLLEVKELNEYKNFKQQEMENLKNEHYKLEDQLNKKKNDIEGLEETIDIYEKIVSENQKHIEKLENSNEELRNLLRNYEKVNKNSQNVLEGLEKKANQIQSIINAYEESNEISKEKQIMLEKTIQDQTLTIQEHEDTIQSMNILQKQLNNLEKINENQSSTIRSYESMIEDLKKSFSTLRKKQDNNSYIPFNYSSKYFSFSNNIEISNNNNEDNYNNNCNDNINDNSNNNNNNTNNNTNINTNTNTNTDNNNNNNNDNNNNVDNNENYYTNLNDDTLHNINVNINKKSLLDKILYPDNSYLSSITSNTEDPKRLRFKNTKISHQLEDNSISTTTSSYTNDTINNDETKRLNNNNLKSLFYTPSKIDSSSLHDNIISEKFSFNDNNNFKYKTQNNRPEITLNSYSSSYESSLNEAIPQTIYKTPFDNDIFIDSHITKDPKKKNLTQLLNEYKENGQYEDNFLKTPVKKEINENETNYIQSISRSKPQKSLSLNQDIKSFNDSLLTPMNQKIRIKSEPSILSENNQYKNSNEIQNNENSNTIDVSSSPSFYTPPQIQTINNDDNNNISSWSDLTPSKCTNKMN